MTKKLEVYKCDICGNIVEMVHEGAGQLVCCGQPMGRLPEKEKDDGLEKHVPIVDGGKVKIGSVPHPMDDKHFIEWIELISNTESCRVFLKPGDASELPVCDCAKWKFARAHCNVHGLWKGAL